MRPFTIFGAEHLAAVGVVIAVAGALTAIAVTRGALARIGLALALTSMAAVHIAVTAQHPAATIWWFLPFHLCDMAILVAVFALLTRRRASVELLYFWTLSGTALAMVTPAVRVGFPAFEFVSYFALHGGVVAAAVVLVFGCGLRPAPGAHWRAFAWTNVYAGLVAVVNLVFDTNYLYLRAPPDAGTLLDAFGPWPLYLLVAEGIALVTFALLALPFRRGQHPPRAAR